MMLIYSFSITAIGQTLESLADTPADQITQEDIQAVLAANNMQLYKLPVNIPEDQKCFVALYKQEYEKRNMIKDENIFGTPSPHRKVEDGQLLYTKDGQIVHTPLEGIRIITKKNDRDFSLHIKMGDSEIKGYPVKIDSIYSNPHHCISFKLPKEYPIGSEIPLVLIGSSWDSTSKDGTKKIQRFCRGVEEVDADLSDDVFDKMPHYVIMGVRIFDPK